MLRLIRQVSGCPFQNPNQLLLIRQVSGTAKGKGKLKDGQPLKRSVITRKKPEPAGGRKREGSERLSRLVESCLTAPTPVRHLTQKQRDREIEREKLGLISKDRQLEIDQAKLKSKKKAEEGDGDSEVVMGTPDMDYISLELVDAEKVPKYELTVEDGRRLAKEYSRVMMRKHRERQKVETQLLKLKKEAIEALPEGLRAKALEIDLKPLPEDRLMATLTPPIEGYGEKVKEAAEKFGGKEKLR